MHFRALRNTWVGNPHGKELSTNTLLFLCFAHAPYSICTNRSLRHGRSQCIHTRPANLSGFRQAQAPHWIQLFYATMTSALRIQWQALSFIHPYKLAVNAVMQEDITRVAEGTQFKAQHKSVEWHTSRVRWQPTSQLQGQELRLSTIRKTAHVLLSTTLQSFLQRSPTGAVY